jgi:hypothetical protein
MGKFHTCISVDKDLWNKYCAKVVRERGHFHSSKVIEELITEYLNKEK